MTGGGMAEYRMRATGEVLDEEAYRALHPNVSFAPGFDPIDADRIVPTEPPEMGRYQRAVRDGIAYDKGAWLEAWRIEDLPAAEAQDIRRQAMAAQWAAIKARRDECETGGVEVNGAWFQTDASSRIKFLAIKDKARDALLTGGTRTTVINQADTAIRWKTFSNSFITMTVGLALDIVEAVGTLDAQAFARAEQHRLAMMQSPDPGAYDFSAGWPPSYEGQQ